MLLKPDHCKSCLGYQWGHEGFVPASGSGKNGVLIVAEAAGENEAEQGTPLVGKAGYYLFQNLARVGIEREGFRCHNVLSCRPPDNKLAKTSFEDSVISSCTPLLDATISDMHERCQKSGKHLVIITLGRIAFKRVMGFTDKSPEMRVDYFSYPFWSERYKCHVIAVQHPSYLMRGNNHLLPVLQFGFTRALEIATNGLKPWKPLYMRDPDAATFQQWIHDYEHAWMVDPDNTILAFDIETPYKQGKDEEEVAREDDDDYTILRCSFAYRAGEAISIPWRAEYKPLLEELFSGGGTKTVWNGNYDIPRITAQMPIHGDTWDAMLMWHVLNSSLPKGLGFVTPFYCQNMPMWKHQSSNDPAGYNAQDSDALLCNAIGIRGDLIKNNLWKVFERHVVQLDRVLGYMSSKGVLRDEVMRADAEVRLQTLLDDVEVKMEEAVPQAARRLKVFKKTPKDIKGMVEVEQIGKVKRCGICGLLNPKKSHWKAPSAKQAKMGTDYACQDGDVVVTEETVKLWAKVLEFKVSKVGLTGYQKALKHQAQLSRKEKKVTFDEQALTRLIVKYPKDKLYPLILQHRELVKLLSTYIGVTENG